MFLQSLQKSQLNFRHVSATPAFLCIDSGEGLATPAKASTEFWWQRYNIQIVVFE
jgi:hypothetical protein